jgi:hypothetical protein
MMDAKKKANELLCKFQGNFKEGERQDVISNALICVDEILETYIELDPKLRYWQEVKQEIEKLK